MCLILPVESPLVEAPAVPHNSDSNRDRSRNNSRDSMGSPTSKDNPTSHIQIPQKSHDRCAMMASAISPTMASAMASVASTMVGVLQLAAQTEMLPTE